MGSQQPGPCRVPRAHTPTWSVSLSMDTERCRLVGTGAGPWRSGSSATARCCATSLAVRRVAVAVRPRKQCTPMRSRSTCTRGGSGEAGQPIPALAAHPRSHMAHLADAQVAGPEVVGPLGEAVGLINAGKSNWRQLCGWREASRPHQRLRCQHQHVYLGCPNLKAARSEAQPRCPPAASLTPRPMRPPPSAGQIPVASWSCPSVCRPP